MPDFFAHLNHFRVRDIRRQVFGEEFLLSVELRFWESGTIIFEEGAGLDVYEARSEVLDSDITVLVDIDVLSEGMQDISRSLFVYLHLQEIGEFFDRNYIADWILESLHQSLYW